MALVTGFEPYGGRGINPSADVAARLNGERVAGVAIIGRTLPVSFNRLPQRIHELLVEYNPAAVVSLGLWPGEPVIRLERLAFNLADFEIPDNEGTFLADTPVDARARAAIPSRLPLRAIERALLDAEIPARLSASAGTFLCNATMYTFLKASEHLRPEVPCGFVHLPYLPAQVARLLKEMKETRSMELHQRADLASMSLDTMVQALRITLATTLSAPSA